MSREELDALILLARTDATGGMVDYRELVALGSSLLDVEELKKQMSDAGHPDGEREMTRVSDGTAASFFASAPGSVRQPLLSSGAKGGYQRRPEGYRFPAWWFVCMAAPSILPGIFSTAFQSIVWPVAVANMAGFSNKAFVFAACGQVAMVMSWSAPLVGALSDRVPERFARAFGRRRPFIVAGRVCSVLGNALLYYAMVGLPPEERSLTLLGAGLVAMNMGGCLASPAFNAVIPDTVPLEQRGLCITIGSWTANVCTVLGFGVGWMLGEGIFFTDTMLWRINIVMWGLDMPFFLIACNGEAGLWKPEHLPAASKPESEPEVASKKNDGSGGGSCQTMVGSFVESFRYPTYKWYWIFLAMNAFSTMVETSFQFFWLQDCFPGGYFFFQWRVASNVKSAVALTGMITTFLSVVCIATLRPHWWRERFGGRQVILWGMLLNYFVRPFSFALFPGNFTLVLLWTAFNAVTSSIATAAQGAIQMDCLPCDENGEPLRAAYDMNMYVWGALVPVTGFPLLLGKAVMWFPSHEIAYSYFWFVGGLVGLLAYTILALLVHPQEEPLDRSCQCTRRYYRRERDYRHRLRVQAATESRPRTTAAATTRASRSSAAPIGAELCDRLLFRAVKTTHTGGSE